MGLTKVGGSVLGNYTPDFTGGVNRTIESKLNETVSAEDFGVAYTGDETTKLQACLDYAISEGITFINVNGVITITALTNYSSVKFISTNGKGGLKVGTDTYTLPTYTETTARSVLYVDDALGSDTNGLGFISASPFKSIQRALDFLPSNIAHDCLINVADGTYDDQGGQDEWGRPVVVDFSKKNINPLRNASDPLDDKRAKVIIRGNTEAGTIIDGSVIGARYGFWIHGIKDAQLEKLTCTGSYGGVICHQGSDVTMYDVTLTGNTYGLMNESQSRVEKIRGSITGNSYGIFATKNSFIQWNGTVSVRANLTANTLNEIVIENSASIYLLRVDGAATAGRDYIVSEGAGKIELDDCDIFGGNHFITGTCIETRIKNGTRLRGFTSSACALNSGYFVSDKNGTVNHIHNNAFIAYVTDGSPIIDLYNVDSNNAAASPEPNTNGVRILGSETSVSLDPLCTVTSTDKILTRPTSGLIFKGTAPPSDATVYYERGAICLNEAAAVGAPQGWICTTKGYGGVAVFTAMPNL